LASVLVVVLAAIVAGDSRPAQAGGQTFVVDSTSDFPVGDCITPAQTCNLPAAIIAANSTPGIDTITFNAGVFHPTPTTTTNIELTSQLPAIDASEGIVIDGDAGGTAARVGVHRHPSFGISFGLTFVTGPGVKAQEVRVRGIDVQGFALDGMQVCAGFTSNDCFGDVENVVLKNTSSSGNGRSGVRVLGNDLSGIIVDSHESTGDLAPIFVSAKHDLSNAAIQAGSITTPGGPAITLLAANDITAADINTMAIDAGAAHDGLAMNVESGNATSTLIVTDNFVTGSNGVDIRSLGPLNGFSFVGNTLNDTNGVIVSGQTISGHFVFSTNVIDGTTTAMGANILSSIAQIEWLGAVVDGNTITNAAHTGMRVSGGILSGAQFTNNTFTGNAGDGLNLDAQADGATETNLVRDNTSENNGHAGIRVYNARATITHNRTSGNGGLGIELKELYPADAVTPNDANDSDVQEDNALQNFPEDIAIVDQIVTGTACPGCLIEMYESTNDASGHGEGVEVLAETTAANDGSFSIPICGRDLESGFRLTLTATNPEGHTSEFSESKLLTESTGLCPSPTATPPHQLTWGDLNCDDEITPLDALIVLLFLDGLSFSQDPPCAELTDELVGGFQFADINCDGAIDELDAVVILAHLADVANPPESGCRLIGEPL
jgi:hypothetical protein